MKFPLPEFLEPDRVSEIYEPDFEGIAKYAYSYRETHAIKPSVTDKKRLVFLAVDIQNTFCMESDSAGQKFELFVPGAMVDVARMVPFIYRNLGNINRIAVTMDSHLSYQVFHPSFLIDKMGRHPEPFTTITTDDINAGKWRVSPAISHMTGYSEESLNDYIKKYAHALADKQHYPYVIWPYHSMAGSIGQALVPYFKEAVFFHEQVRQANARFEQKGRRMLAEAYSVLGPDVTLGIDGSRASAKNDAFIEYLLNFDRIVIAGQPASHSVAWTVMDLLAMIDERQLDKASHKLYLLEDCMSPLPGYEDSAAAWMDSFAKQGVNIIQSDTDLDEID